MEASAALVEATKEMAGPGGCVSGDIIDTLRQHGVLGLWEQTHLGEPSLLSLPHSTKYPLTNVLSLSFLSLSPTLYG
jgi:hypothetical protein